MTGFFQAIETHIETAHCQCCGAGDVLLVVGQVYHHRKG